MLPEALLEGQPIRVPSPRMTRRGRTATNCWSAPGALHLRPDPLCRAYNMHHPGVGSDDPGQHTDTLPVLHGQLEVAEGGEVDGNVGREGMAVRHGWAPSDLVATHGLSSDDPR